MPGFYHVGPVKVNGILQSAWMCDKCRKIFAFQNGETLQCPRCKGRGYPINSDPEPSGKLEDEVYPMYEK